MTTALEKITWIDNGLLDVSKIIRNLETIRDVVDEVERLRVKMADDLDSQYPPALSYAVDTMGDHVVLRKTIRAEMQLAQVYIMAGADGDDTQIELLLNGTDALCDPVTVKATEGRGKVVVGDALEYVTISRFDEIVVRTDSNRRVVVSMSFKAVND